MDGNSLPALIPTALIQGLLVGLEQPHVLVGMRWCGPSFPLGALAEPRLQPGPLLAARTGRWQALQLGTSTGNIPKLFAGLGPVSATAVASQRLGAALYPSLRDDLSMGHDRSSLDHELAVCWP